MDSLTGWPAAEDKQNIFTTDSFFSPYVQMSDATYEIDIQCFLMFSFCLHTHRSVCRRGKAHTHVKKIQKQPSDVGNLSGWLT